MQYIVTTRRGHRIFTAFSIFSMALLYLSIAIFLSPFSSCSVGVIAIVIVGLFAFFSALGMETLRSEQTAVLQDDRVAIQKGKERLILPLSAIEKIEEKFDSMRGVKRHWLDIYYRLNGKPQCMRLIAQKTFLREFNLSGFGHFIQALQQKKQKVAFDPLTPVTQAHLLPWHKRHIDNILICTVIFLIAGLPICYNDWAATLVECKKAACIRTRTSFSTKGGSRNYAEFNINGKREEYLMPSSQSVKPGDLKEREYWKGALWGEKYRIVW